MLSSSQLELLNQKLALTRLRLEQSEVGLCLSHPEFKPFCIDFLSASFQSRSSPEKLLTELVVKACGAKKQLTVLDLTAGLGRDAFLLSSVGAKVIMIERNPIIHALLEDGLNRLKQEHDNFPLSLVRGDSLEVLSKIVSDHVPDVIYIDPMHPERKKSALVKKELRIIRALVGNDEDKGSLFDLALNCGVKKVVVKWPLKAPSCISRKPTTTYSGKHTRFDVYARHY